MPGMNMYSRDDLAGMMDGAYDADDEEDYGAYGGAYGGGDDEGAEPPEPGLGACSPVGIYHDQRLPTKPTERSVLTHDTQGLLESSSSRRGWTPSGMPLALRRPS